MVPIFLVYLVGITATVWHLANGIWLFLVDWGITIGERAQRLTGYACIGFGVVLLLVGINAADCFHSPWRTPGRDSLTMATTTLRSRLLAEDSPDLLRRCELQKQVMPWTFFPLFQ